MNEIIQIKCPFCGAVLSVKDQQGIETKNVTCPVCKHLYPFVKFKKVSPTLAGDESDTEYPDREEHTSYNCKCGQSGREETELNNNHGNFSLGMLKVAGTDISFRLRPGRNIIGRRAQKTGADIQIDTAGKRSMSREHIVIEVKKIPAKGFVHYISLFKEKVNKTFIDGEQLLYGDCIILNDGALIELPDATLKFEIPDNDNTTF